MWRRLPRLSGSCWQRMLGDDAGCSWGTVSSFLPATLWMYGGTKAKTKYGDPSTARLTKSVSLFTQDDDFLGGCDEEQKRMLLDGEFGVVAVAGYD
jgi:hypothetical protein